MTEKEIKFFFENLDLGEEEIENESQIKDLPKKKAKKAPAKKKGQNLKVNVDKSNTPPEVVIEGSKTSSKNLQDIITKDETLLDLIQEVKTLKKKVDELEKEDLFTLHDKNICYLGLCRVIKQLSGSRSSDYKKQAILVKEKLEAHLIQEKILPKKRK